MVWGVVRTSFENDLSCFCIGHCPSGFLWVVVGTNCQFQDLTGIIRRANERTWYSIIQRRFIGHTVNALDSHCQLILRLKGEADCAKINSLKTKGGQVARPIYGFQQSTIDEYFNLSRGQRSTAIVCQHDLRLEYTRASHRLDIGDVAQGSLVREKWFDASARLACLIHLFRTSILHPSNSI